MRKRGGFFNREHWYSICSSHHEYDENCPRCNAGSWEKVWKLKVSAFVYEICPNIWRWWVNRK